MKQPAPASKLQPPASCLLPPSLPATDYQLPATSYQLPMLHSVALAEPSPLSVRTHTIGSSI